MNVRIHIDRLILDAPAMTRAQEQQLRMSLTQELTRLVKRGKLSPEMLAGGRLRSVQSEIHASADSPSGMGRGIANGVYGAIGNGDRQPLRHNGPESTH